MSIVHSIQIETDGKLCGKGCPWLPKRFHPMWGYDCQLFDNMVKKDEGRYRRCLRCEETEKRLKRMKP